jgi:hypothetical protein
MTRGGGGFVISALIERIVANGTPGECNLLNECLAGLKDEVEGRQKEGIKGSSALLEGISLLGLKVSSDDI